MTGKILTTMGLVAALGCGGAAPDATPAGITEIPSYTVRAESLPAMLPVDGTVQGAQRAVLSTRLMARVVSLDVDAGARVQRGQTLLRLGVDDVAAHRARALAGVAAAEAAHAEAARQAARMDTLLAQDAVARVQRDQAHLQRDQAAAQLAAARAGLAEVDAASAYATIRAPFAGAVAQRFVNVGDLAAPGMPLIVVEGGGPREALLAVPVDVARQLVTGMTIRVVGPAGWSGDATLRAVGAGADPRTRTVDVRATLPADWPTGIAVTALIPAGVRQTIAIPEATVVRRGQLTGVRVVTPQGPVLRWVRLGRSLAPSVDETADRVEVLSGLQVGERIAL